MRFKIGGAAVTVDYLFFFMLSMMLLYNRQATLIMLTLSFLHEAGHVAALVLLGGKVNCLRLSAFGMVMVPVCNELSFYQESLFILAGPSVNLIIAVVLLPFSCATVQQISALSMLLGLFNLLPISALDGGKALWYFLQMHFREAAVTKAIRVVSVITLCLLGVFGLFLLYQNHYNFSVLLIVVYLTILLINKPMN